MQPVYERIAKSLQDFGYEGSGLNAVTWKMVEECVTAYHEGSPMPHGVIGSIIKTKLDDEREERNQR